MNWKTVQWKISRWTFLVTQMVKRQPTMQETQVRSLGGEDPLEKGMATHSSSLSWKIPWMEEPGRLHSMRLQRVRYNWATSLTDLCVYKLCWGCENILYFYINHLLSFWEAVCAVAYHRFNQTLRWLLVFVRLDCFWFALILRVSYFRDLN